MWEHKSEHLRALAEFERRCWYSALVWLFRLSCHFLFFDCVSVRFWCFRMAWLLAGAQRTHNPYAQCIALRCTIVSGPLNTSSAQQDKRRTNDNEIHQKQRRTLLAKIVWNVEHKILKLTVARKIKKDIKIKVESCWWVWKWRMTTI